MGIEVPEGSAAPEQPKSPEDVSGSTKPSEEQQRKNKMRGLLAVALLAVLAVAGLLTALVPDYGNDDIKEETPLEADKNESLASSYFESSVGPFDVKIPLFSSNITNGYDSVEETEEDLQQLAKFVLNQAITNNVDSGVYSRQPVFNSPPKGVPGDVTTSDGAAEANVGNGDAAGTTDDLSGLTDFETNNQEDNVDTADLAKSDGTFVFAAYGEYLLVWAADTGMITARILMPAVDMEPDCSDWQNDIIGEPSPVDGGFAADSYRPSYYCWTPKPNIEALLVEDGRLGVIVSGYGVAHAAELEETPYIRNYQNTHIRIYDINAGDPKLVSTKDVNGSFRRAFSVNGNGHVVTQAWLNTWDHLLGPIQRWQEEFVDMDDDEYLAAATMLAETELIPQFTTRLLEQLGDVDLARLSIYADSVSSTGDAETSLFAGGIANAITQVVSFDMMENDTEDLTVSIAATLQPGSWGHVYATEGMIIVADQGWSWVEDSESSGEKTYLLGFRLDGASSTYSVVGSVAGYPLNPYSLDFVSGEGGSYVRIATTQSFWNFRFEVMELSEGVLDDEDLGEAVSSNSSQINEGITGQEEVPEPESSTINQIIILKIPSASGDEEESELEEVGSVNLGKPNERFTSVRFFDDFAYAVTFERIDPFYVVDLKDPTDPFAIGELEVSGFSEYLHPIDDDNTELIAVGQETKDGRIVGLQVSLFDAGNPKNPRLVDRVVVENDDNQWSSSTVSWDERAFRWLSTGDKTGFVIIPVTIYSRFVVFEEPVEGEEKPEPEENNNFEGFMVFSVKNNKITRVFDIDHSGLSMTSVDGCYPCGWLPERSFVFNGDVMTIKGQSVLSTDLVTGDNEWTLDGDDLGGACCSRR